MAVPSEKECVKVVVRCRPMSQRELDNGHKVIVDVDESAASVSLRNLERGANDVKTFTFDHTFASTCRQGDVYQKTARPIVEAVLNGYNGTIFAYGQTGSGKSFSMTGVREDAELKGIIPRSFDHIFDHINQSGANVRYLVRASYLEIYNEEIRDLLVSTSNGPKQAIQRLELKEHPDSGVYVKDLSSYVVQNTQEIDKLLNIGAKNRSVGATLMNAESSRSHSIFTITVEQITTAAEEATGEEKEHIRVGKLHLVDLAGSERQAKTGATGARLKEAAKINLSLTALGNVIAALVDGKSSHVPYRDSKLTRLLQDSLGGNSKTVMIATMSPASYNFDETLSTLRYANRTKQIKNKPKINEDPKDTMLREFQEEIARLKAQLETLESGGSAIGATADDEASSEGDEGDDINQGSNDVTAPRRSKAVVNVAATTNVGPTLKVQLEEVAKEREALLANKDMVEASKMKLLQELDVRARELEAEQRERQALEQKLEQMQNKLLVGGTNILDQSDQQRMELERQAAELEEQHQRERKLHDELQQRQEWQVQLEESYSSLQEEAQSKTEKLKRVWAMIMECKEEMNDLQSEFYRQKEEMLSTVHDLASELHLKTLMVDAFIPSDFLQLIERHATYDAENDQWLIAYAESTGNPTAAATTATKNGRRRPDDATDARSLFSQLYSNPTILFPDMLLSYEMYVPGAIGDGTKSARSKVPRPPVQPTPQRGRPQSSLLKQQQRQRTASALAVRQEVPVDEVPVSRGLVASTKRYA